MKRSRENYEFKDALELNDATYVDYLNRFQRIALSMIEWVNLPKSMDARYLELCLFYNGQAALLKDPKYGFINTKASAIGYVNIYGLPTKVNCFSYSYQSVRTLYTGLDPRMSDKQFEYQKNNECILVMNNEDRLPTAGSLSLFAWRLYNADRTCDVNIQAQKTPVMILADEKQRQTMINMYNQYNGNIPFIFGDKNLLTDGSSVEALKTDAPYIVDKISDYKKEIWNEALTYLGINNVARDKKERLTENESNENNELVNLNLQAMLIPRIRACKQFNEKYGLNGTGKEITACCSVVKKSFKS